MLGTVAEDLWLMAELWGCASQLQRSICIDSWKPFNSVHVSSLAYQQGAWVCCDLFNPALLQGKSRSFRQPFTTSLWFRCLERHCMRLQLSRSLLGLWDAVCQGVSYKNFFLKPVVRSRMVSFLACRPSRAQSVPTSLIQNLLVVAWLEGWSSCLLGYSSPASLPWYHTLM